MRNLANEDDRIAILRRFGTLSPRSRAGWGRMSVGRMLCHVGDALRMATGDLPVKPGPRTVFRRFPLKHLLLYLLPVPKNVPTAPELLARDPEDFESDRAIVGKLVRRFGDLPRIGAGPEHPLFGTLSRSEWSVLQWRHLDHHLRQFGA